MKFPKVLEQVPKVMLPSKYDEIISELHRVWDAREFLGFVLIDQDGLKRLSAVKPDYVGQQTPYIPPRI